MTKYTVYIGKISDQIVYVGTTIQKPEARWRWHKANGKAFNFSIHYQYDTPEEMLKCEHDLILKYNPVHNKIKHRIQNLNKKLTIEQINQRKGDKQWCQGCLKRRVNIGYTYCGHC
jgi:predicted GIY-YIG superfamily endonuclease